jgi:hypothetical protein
MGHDRPQRPRGDGDHLGQPQRPDHDRATDHPEPILDQISTSSGNWDNNAHLLTVTAATSKPSDTLQACVSGTTQLIGTMTNLGNGNYQGQSSWPVNPGYVDIKSSGGATVTGPITAVSK